MTGRLQLENLAEFSIRMTTDTSNYRRGIIWNDAASDTKIAEIGYHNTVQRIFLNPLGSTEVWDDAAGKYSFISRPYRNNHWFCASQYPFYPSC